MTDTLKELPFKHSEGLPLGIDIFSLDKLYERASLDHKITEPHRLGFYALLFVTAGQGIHTVDFHAYQIQPQTLIIISKNQVNQFDPALRLKGYIILITEAFIHRALFDLEGTLTRMLFDPITTHAYCLRDATSIYAHLERLIEEYRREHNDPEQMPILTRELGLLLLNAERLRKEQVSVEDQLAESSPRLIAFRQLIQLHVADHWTAQQYADALGFSKKTLGTLTRKYLNRSPKEVIDQRLLLEIKRLLAHTGTSVKEIAIQLGFEDPSNMSKFFKRMQGNTPKAFRQQIKF